MEASAFNLGAGEFVPMGKMNIHTEEQFPTLGEDAGPTKVGGGKKRKNKGKAQINPVESVKKEEEDNAWKGKPSSFFEMTQK